MTKLEAIKAMCDGKKVYNTEWDMSEQYLYMSSKGRINDNDDDMVNISVEYDDGWEIFVEPKEKVKLYKYIWKRNDEWLEDCIYHKDDKSFREYNFLTSDTDFKRLDYTMIEVEE